METLLRLFQVTLSIRDLPQSPDRMGVTRRDVRFLLYQHPSQVQLARCWEFILIDEDISESEKGEVSGAKVSAVNAVREKVAFTFNEDAQEQ